MRAFTSSASKSRGPVDLGRNMLKSYFGSGFSIPFPFVDFGKAWNVISDPTLFKGPEVSDKEGKAIVAEYKRQYADYKNKGGSRSYGSWIKWRLWQRIGYT